MHADHLYKWCITWRLKQVPDFSDPFAYLLKNDRTQQCFRYSLHSLFLITLDVQLTKKFYRKSLSNNTRARSLVFIFAAVGIFCPTKKNTKNEERVLHTHAAVGDAKTKTVYSPVVDMTVKTIYAKQFKNYIAEISHTLCTCQLLYNFAFCICLVSN